MDFVEMEIFRKSRIMICFCLDERFEEDECEDEELKVLNDVCQPIEIELRIAGFAGFALIFEASSGCSSFSLWSLWISD